MHTVHLFRAIIFSKVHFFSNLCVLCPVESVYSPAAHGGRSLPMDGLTDRNILSRATYHRAPRYGDVRTWVEG